MLDFDQEPMILPSYSIPPEYDFIGSQYLLQKRNMESV